jgi:hypothetical protein
MNRSSNNVQKTSSASTNTRGAHGAGRSKPSEWLCKFCGFTNLAGNTKCACGALKSGGSYAGAKNAGASCAGGICQITDQ